MLYFNPTFPLSPTILCPQHLIPIGMLHNGIEIVRMLSRKTKGCGTFKDCNHANIHLDAVDPTQRVRNWYSFYCHDQKKSSSAVVHKPSPLRLQQQRQGTSSSSSSSSSSSLSSPSAAHVMDCLSSNTESSTDTSVGPSPNSNAGDGSTSKVTSTGVGVGASADTSAIPSFRCFTSWDSNWTLNRQDKSRNPTNLLPHLHKAI